ncbi:putative RNA-binding Zn ribbon-like protein [Kitasatospora sp. MAA4]|uniref:CGNR zinc finger domain-containing protein n=1 Tax=Kitasatospora sp. MAA4 TaxID=3035093 RepID=UPI002474900C|nr:ABATE domain-containing protein [Kitasatospora sp. MAA4]MDH6135629.1 putative RNA-binding Zn ribbon-like protein [Kitasatospora sp. MAA4]
MTATTENPRFRQGAGRLCLDYLRTLRRRGMPDATEELTDPAALAAWVRQCGPCGSAAGAADAGQLAEARRLREAVHTLVLAGRSPQGPGSCPAPDRELVNRWAALPVPTPGLDPAGRLHWHADDPVAATLALLARDSLDLVSSAAIGRVRDCACPECSALFSDTSRPGNRRWCSMDECGNRAKKKALRSRAAAS